MLLGTRLLERTLPHLLDYLLGVKFRACTSRICLSTRAQYICISAARMILSIHACGGDGTSWWAGWGQVVSDKECLEVGARHITVYTRLVSTTLAMIAGSAPDDSLVSES